MPNWKKIIVSGSDASLSSAYIEGNLTASAAFLTSASIGHLETIYETASVIYTSGSTKFGDTSDDTHERTGSLLVSGNITLSEGTQLTGTSSFAITASHALNVPDTASHALTAVTASYTNGTASIADFATTASHILPGGLNSGSFSGSFEGDGSGLTGISVTQAATITDTFTAETSVTVSHNFVTENVLVTVYTDNGEQLIPQTIRTLDENNVGVDFADTTTGRIVVAKGGHIVSGSVLTASLAMELSNLATASIADFATTASYTIGTASIANFATTASYISTASFADSATTASQANNATTASQADNATTASYAVTASYALNAAGGGGGGGGIGATNAQTLSVDFHVSESQTQLLLIPLEIEDGVTITVENDAFLYTSDFSAPSLVDSSSVAISASYATNTTNATSASYVLLAQTSSHAIQSQNSNSASGSLSFWQGSQVEYDLISASADPNTVYFVV